MSKEKEIFHEHLKRSRLKRTEQRDLILDVFIDTEGHVSVEELYDLVKKKDSSVGFTTVYRTMKLMTEAGLAHEVRFTDGRARYEHEYDHQHHDHLICNQCDSVIEFYNPEIEKLQEEIARQYKFQIQDHSHRMFGICFNCQEISKDKLAKKTYS
ncbi:MAG: transcriptional repressor [Blastocatellia bacterium]|nr:transcriptional repressor [Blastocatellia bacterium]MBL8196195.1 transcriptional repressor [Blastocatellia bacterium]MBN8724109.1 transcriptional repressor [Acidobacteriota bacterium]